MRACGEAGNGFVGMAVPCTRPDILDDELLLLDPREMRSRTTCGMSTRWVYVIIWPLRCFLSFVRCGDGLRGMSITLSCLERAGLRGGVWGDSSSIGCEGFLRSRDGGRTAVL